MPTIICPIEHKTVGQTSPGELFRMEAGSGLAICITLETGPSRKSLIGLLSWEEADRPVFLHLENSTACVSFGTDWVVDPHYGPESRPHRSYVQDDTGVLFLQENDAVVRFDRVDRYSDFESINASILGNGRVDRTARAVPFRRWQIWRSVEDRDRIGAEPVVAFDGAQPPSASS